VSFAEFSTKPSGSTLCSLYVLFCLWAKSGWLAGGCSQESRSTSTRMSLSNGGRRLPIRSPQTRSQMPSGNPFWTTLPTSPRFRSSNPASLISSAICYASNARAALALSRCKRLKRSVILEPTRSGRMSASAYSTRPAPIGRGGMKRMAAGRIGQSKAAHLQNGVARAK